jgi:hypothetical protein
MLVVRSVAGLVVLTCCTETLSTCEARIKRRGKVRTDDCKRRQGEGGQAVARGDSLMYGTVTVVQRWCRIDRCTVAQLRVS